LVQRKTLRVNWSARELRVTELPHLLDLFHLLLGRLLLRSDVHLIFLPLHLREEPGFLQTSFSSNSVQHFRLSSGNAFDGTRLIGSPVLP
jgi:hypothetical protein